MSSKRISSIDIGSNAIRQIIVEVKPDGTWAILKKHREPIRLGSDVFTHKKIQNSTEKRLLLAFKRMAKLNAKFKVNKSIALATSAFRDASNKKLILSAIYKTSGIRVQIISGTQEAHLIRLAVQNCLNLNGECCLLLDIGGGSIELTKMQKNKILYAKSFKWGMVRMLTEAKKFNISPQSLLKYKMKKNKSKLPKGSFDIAIGTGGNLDALAKLKLILLKKGPNTFLTVQELEKIYSRFTKTAPSLRMKKMNLKKDRVDVIEPAMYLTLQLMKKYQIQKIKIPAVGLKEGAILSVL